MIKIITKPAEMKAFCKDFIGSENKRSLGFVPTMGALHQGHASLLEKSRSENDLSVLSIYVNSTQFNNKEDYDHYPNTWEEDLILAKKKSVDVIFKPTYEDMYPDDFTFKVIESRFSHVLCGADRPGHFDGVLTVVMKLLNIISPNKVYFGEKDYQQLLLIKNMIEAFFLPIEVISVKTFREQDGLAMSSRNLRLTENEKRQAHLLYQTIKSPDRSTIEAQEYLEHLGFKVHYLHDLEFKESNSEMPKKRRFIAATLGNVRLIDNVEI